MTGKWPLGQNGRSMLLLLWWELFKTLLPEKVIPFPVAFQACSAFIAGNLYETSFESGKLARGVYYYTLTNGTERMTKRMVLDK
jgi:hypothetical protein